jgi:transposase
MSSISNISSSNALEFAAQIGFDWGDKQHAVALFDGNTIESKKIAAAPESLHGWLKEIGQRFEGKPVALALECTRGAVLNAFSAYPWLTIYPVNPLTSAQYRRAFVPSRAKDDVPDAQYLLEILRCHPEHLRPLEMEDEQTRQLDALVQARRDAVDRRTQCVNQLTSLLKTYYPQAIEWAGQDLGTPLALNFLTRWPDLLSLKAAKPGTVKKFFYANQVRRPESMQRRLDGIQNAVCLTTDPVVISVAVLQLKMLVDVIRTFQKHIAILEEKIAQCFKAHPEAWLFRDLPGAGPAMAPRLLVAFGTDRSRYGSAANLQKYAGIAPVVERSGSQCWTHWRWQAPRFLRQTFVEWAGQTVIWCAWAKGYYRAMKAKGKSHHVIIRALAFKWIRILWKCWHDKTPYDETVYVNSMVKRHSPYAKTVK